MTSARRAIDAHPFPKTLPDRRTTHAARNNRPRAHDACLHRRAIRPTQWSTAEDKAKFANALMKFIAHEFPRQGFTKSLYHRLSNTFGHIAHTNLDGFYCAFFERDADKVVFLDQTLSWPHLGDPTYTFSDVERAVQRRLRASNVIDVFRMREADATRKRELETLARLQEKYGARPPAPDPSPLAQRLRKPRLSMIHQGDRQFSP